MDPARKKVNAVPKATLLCVITLGGTMATSGFNICDAANATRHVVKMPKSMTIIQWLHEYVEPPH